MEHKEKNSNQGRVFTWEVAVNGIPKLGLAIAK